MKFVFEDAKGSTTAKLFREAYPVQRHADFEYTLGNGNIEDTVRGLLKGSNENIVVYLDAVPGNNSITDIYRSLKILSINNGYRVIVLPIPGAEYYLLKLLCKYELVTNMIGVDIALERQFYKHSPILNKPSGPACNNFEHYCKLLVRENIKPCANLRKCKAGSQHLVFYTNTCRCQHGSYGCPSNLSVRDKAIEFVKSYECYPSGSYIPGGTQVVDIWSKHRELVDKFNGWVDLYRECDGGNKAGYRKISYIK